MTRHVMGRDDEVVNDDDHMTLLMKCMISIDDVEECLIMHCSGYAVVS